MPIYEYYSPDTHRIYSFYAKTLAQGRLIPKCPDNPKARMRKLVSGFAIGGTHKAGDDETATAPGASAAGNGGDARLEAAMGSLEREFSQVDENDPRAMARMMRRMAELGGEPLDGPMEEVVRKLEEGADPDSVEEQFGDLFGGEGEEDAPPPGSATPEPKEGRGRFKVRRPPPSRDPKLYDYE